MPYLGLDAENRLTTQPDPGTAVKIAVLGDSLATQNYSMGPAWPAVLEQQLRSCGANAEVYNVAFSSGTFFRANTVDNFGTNTAVEQVIALAPDIVIVSLGYNDAVGNVDTRTLAQTQADAAATFDALRAGLPAAKILYLGQRAYDPLNSSNLGSTDPALRPKNAAVIGALMNRAEGGIIAGSWSVEHLPTAITFAVGEALNNWTTLDTACRADPDVDVHGTIELWKIHRMGGALFDMLHTGPAAAVLMAAYATKSLLDVAFAALLPGLRGNDNASRNDPDALFTAMFTASGTSWLYTANADALSVEDSLWRQLRPHNWYLPRDINSSTNVTLSGTVGLENPGYFMRVVRGLKPGAQNFVSVNGADFAAGSGVADGAGEMVGISELKSLFRAYGGAATTYRHKFDDICLDPVTFSITDGAPATPTIPASETLTLFHYRKKITYSGASAGTITIPNDSTVAWPNDSQFEIIQTGAGTFTVAAGAGVTINKHSSLTFTSKGQYATIGITKVAANTWVLFGLTT